MAGELDVSTLSVGTHVITAHVTDEGGLVGSSSFSVTVTEPPPAPPPFRPSRKAWAFVLDGHVFYVMDSSGAGTLVYDATTRQWCIWRTADLPFWNMHRGHVWRSRTLAADAAEGVIWEVDPHSALDEQEHPIARVVTGFQPVRGSGSSRQGSMRLSARRQTSLGDYAKVALRYSDDGGRTWSTARTLVLAPGVKSKRIEWRSLGRLRAPGRIWELSDLGGLVRIDGADSDMDGGAE